MKNIVVAMKIDEQRLQKISELPNVQMEVIPEPSGPYTLPPELVRKTHILFCELPPLNISDMDALEWVQLGSSGYAQLASLGLPARGVAASNALGVFDTAIAEWNVAMMINLARDVRGLIRHQETGVWDRSARFQREIRGSTAGIWGYGGIGRETARLLKAMGIHVHVMVRESVKQRNAQYVQPNTGDPQGVLPDQVFVSGQEESFLSALDFLILALPITNVTKGMIGERELHMLPSTAFLLNPARGPLVQEEALLRALREGWIAGAALDTHYYYPMPADHPLWRFPNVIMTPHISGSSLSPYYLQRVWDLFLENAMRDCSGQPLLNELSPAQLNGL
ncbi:MAG: D-2-hydroxyacid dehydrogenase [Paenibacillus sp.]|jgi:phosphoglycerate dehydrogenase-like enzyme|nr:D-2-hydroxyacid dehydrogenase [Paenibacillus sp.]